MGERYHTIQNLFPGADLQREIITDFFAPALDASWNCNGRNLERSEPIFSRKHVRYIEVSRYSSEVPDATFWPVPAAVKTSRIA